ncbi:prolipoprotein diacylglyceryl transferase [Paraliomyxa miuraensis]|uniref:prolipoprotein diacylglyceryl transferase n=1 Tax=Paraliomyxa miuraensis TaxID=376150 RepID=UPI0022564954|nr:prolipoprotein diacylglyceryl transferase [Paraliomyxa miuraensis]MCX4245469.1 prolipoprotein diacylglyceryl transferase [Paraliomyxa miuraensis]
MRPVLLELPGWGPLNAYGTLILLGGLLAMPGLYWELRTRGLGRGRPGTMLLDLYLILIFSVAVGGRVVHVLTTPGDYFEHPSRLWALDGTGFVFFGSLLATLGGFYWLARRYETTYAQICDAGATWMPLGHALGRMGCAMAGCCWGAPTDVPWAIRFGPESVAYLAGEVPHQGAQTVALHPTQLYEAIGLLTLFAVLLVIRRRRGIEAPWRQASRYAVGYGVLRTILEIFRGDPSRTLLVELRASTLAQWLGLPPDQPLLLSFSQAIALGLLALGLWGLRRTRDASSARGTSASSG